MPIARLQRTRAAYVERFTFGTVTSGVSSYAMPSGAPVWLYAMSRAVGSLGVDGDTRAASSAGRQAMQEMNAPARGVGSEPTESHQSNASA